MKKLNIICALACSILLADCEKRKYPVDKIKPGSEEIFFDGEVDGEPILLKIGADGYYCYSSYFQQPNDVNVFEGHLRKYGCNPCPSSFKLQLFDSKPLDPGTSIFVDSAFRQGKRNLIPNISKISTLKFTPESNKIISSVVWKLSTGESSQDSAASFEFSKPGLHTLSLTVRTNDNCESTTISKIFAGGDTGIFVCGIKITSMLDKTVEFKVQQIGGRPPYKYSWHFGDGSTSNLSSPSHEYDHHGAYPVYLVVEDANNNRCESSFIHVTSKDKSTCATNILFSHVGFRSGNVDGARIQWTDASNVSYNSGNVAQPSNSYFEIVDSKEYEKNERGEAGRLLTLRFNLLLGDGKRQFWFKSENTVIAVAYK